MSYSNDRQYFLVPKFSVPGERFQTSKEVPKLEPRGNLPALSQFGHAHRPVKTNPKVPEDPATSFILTRSKNGCLVKVHYVCRIRTKAMVLDFLQQSFGRLHLDFETFWAFLG